MQYGSQISATCEDLKIVWCTEAGIEGLHKSWNLID